MRLLDDSVALVTFSEKQAGQDVISTA